MKNEKHSRRNLHRDHLIEVTYADGSIAYGSDLKAVAEALHVSVGAVSNCCRKHISRVRGCTMRWVDSASLKEVAI